MNKEELIKIFSAYLPYKTKVLLPDGQVRELAMVDAENHCVACTESNGMCDVETVHKNGSGFKLCLYDLSYLTKEIEYEGRKIVPVEYFEITDDSDSYPIEHDHGNIKLIKDLESIAKNNSYHDIQFLPFEVVQRLISFHINVFGLKENEFINKATLNK